MTKDRESFAYVKGSMGVKKIIGDAAREVGYGITRLTSERYGARDGKMKVYFQNPLTGDTSVAVIDNDYNLALKSGNLPVRELRERLLALASQRSASHPNNT